MQTQGLPHSWDTVSMCLRKEKKKKGRKKQRKGGRESGKEQEEEETSKDTKMSKLRVIS